VDPEEPKFELSEFELSSFQVQVAVNQSSSPVQFTASAGSASAPLLPPPPPPPAGVPSEHACVSLAEHADENAVKHFLPDLLLQRGPFLGGRAWGIHGCNAKALQDVRIGSG
jgi:hypothetical protein